MSRSRITSFFFFNDTAPTEIYTLSLHDALPISPPGSFVPTSIPRGTPSASGRSVLSADLAVRSEEHTSELQSHHDLVCRLLLEKKKTKSLKEKARQRSHDDTTEAPPPHNMPRPF